VKNTILFLLATLVAGCAEIPLLQSDKDKPAHNVTDDRLKALYSLNAWALKGRIGIQTDKEGVTATLHWAQVGDRYQLRFIAPLSQGTYELRGNQQQVALQTAKNELFIAKDPEQLLLDNVGWKVPLTGLFYWVRGLPEPGADIDNLVKDDKGRIKDMVQSGWRISILRYTEVNDFELPGKLFLQNDRFKLRLVIQGWQTLS
jgi:outer membrane lipoprotein LolB